MAIRGILNLVRLTPQIEVEIINQVYFRSRSQIIESTRNTLRGSLRSHPTYTSISSGQYNAYFGFYPETGETRMNAIVQQAVESINVELTKVKNLIKLNGTIDNSILYALNEANVINNSRNAQLGKTPRILPWLQWLLEFGTQFFITDYHMSLGDYSDKNYSRSQEAIMKRGGEFAVPADIAGTLNNNWITESIEISEKKLSPAIKRIITNEMNRLRL